jgi:hypothetical protein
LLHDALKITTSGMNAMRPLIVAARPRVERFISVHPD